MYKKPYKPGITIRRPLPNKPGRPIGGKKGKKGYNRKRFKREFDKEGYERYK